MALVDDLAALRHKYTMLLSLRRSRERLEACGVYSLEGAAAAARRADKQALAARFPGALRELEHLNAAAIVQRLATVDAELHDARQHRRRRRPTSRWLRAVLALHGAWREHQMLRRWLREHQNLEGAELVRACRSWYRTCGIVRRAAEQIDAAWLAQLQQPPEGGLNALVWLDVARQFKRKPVTVQRWVFGKDVIS